MRKIAKNRVDMSGKTYNSWKVIEPDLEKSKGKALYWKAECLECTNVFSVWGANIRSGLSKRCTACGCKHTHNKQTGQIRTKRTSRESAFYYLHKDLKKSAKKRKLKWELSASDVYDIVNRNCHYCGVAPSLLCSPLKHQGLNQKNVDGANILRNGIDRVDSSKGYTIDNVVPCCHTCNTAKMSMSSEQFLDWVSRVFKHSCS